MVMCWQCIWDGSSKIQRADDIYPSEMETVQVGGPSKDSEADECEDLEWQRECNDQGNVHIGVHGGSINVRRVDDVAKG